MKNIFGSKNIYFPIYKSALYIK